jgi:hypothetical protein
MKMTSEDYENLKLEIIDTLNENPQMWAEYKKIGLSHKRYRWDLLWLSGFDITSLYHYLNDDHIDTALRRLLGS